MLFLATKDFTPFVSSSFFTASGPYLLRFLCHQRSRFFCLKLVPSDSPGLLFLLRFFAFENFTPNVSNLSCLTRQGSFSFAILCLQIIHSLCVQPVLFDLLGSFSLAISSSKRSQFAVQFFLQIVSPKSTPSSGIIVRVSQGPNPYQVQFSVANHTFLVPFVNEAIYCTVRS